jgi:hypothetical protein
MRRAARALTVRHACRRMPRLDSSRRLREGGIRMIRKIAFALALTFAASLVAQVLVVSGAVAGPCTYTSSDKKKGYKC